MQRIRRVQRYAENKGVQRYAENKGDAEICRE